MDLNQSSSSSDLTFQYLLYQPLPKRNKVYVWVDGDPSKYLYSLDYLCALGKKFLSASPDYEFFLKSLNTYSFYLWDFQKQKIFHLPPAGAEDIEQTIQTLLQKQIISTLKPSSLSKPIFEKIEKMEFTDIPESFTNPSQISLQKSSFYQDAIKKFFKHR